MPATDPLPVDPCRPPAGERVRVEGAGGRRLAGRLWPAPPEADVVVVLHGAMSHSHWFHLWGPEMVARGVSLLAPDRRGSGLNQQPPGDAETAEVLLDDLDRWVELAGQGGRRVHLCGFCWGSNYALHYLSRRRRSLASLLLVVPGIFPTARVTAAPMEAGESSEACVEVPIHLEDFTRGPLLEGYLRRDPLYLPRVSPRFVGIQREMAVMLPVKLARVRLPTLFVMAEEDEVTDNARTRQLYDQAFGDRGRWVELPGPHGVNLERPVELAEHCAAWCALTPPSPARRRR